LLNHAALKKNADRSPYAAMAENDRHKKLKGLSRILRNFGRRSACLLEKYLILLEKSGFFQISDKDFFMLIPHLLIAV